MDDAVAVAAQPKRQARLEESMTARGALWVLTGVFTLLHLAWAASLGPGNDEAYHALLASRLDWSYFDHPPMMAVIAAIGRLLTVGEPTIFVLRLGFVALFAGSTLLTARLTSRFYGPTAGTIAAFVLNATAYYGFAASTFVLPDGPLLFFWLLTLDRLAVAFKDPVRLGPWVGVGLAWGCALLSKYHAVFLPAGIFVYALVEPQARPVLRRLGPYLAFAIGIVVFSPVIAWNASHHWASFAFQGGRAVGSAKFRPDALAGAIAGQAMYYLPWIWIPLLVTLANKIRTARKGEAEPGDRFFLSQSAPPLLAFLAVACTRAVLPHWSLIGLLPVIPMLGQRWARTWATRPSAMLKRFVILAAAPILIAALFALHAQTGCFQREGRSVLRLVPVANDPTCDLYGWDQVTAELKRRHLTEAPIDFLFTSRWYQSGHLAFANPGNLPVLCYNRNHAQNFAFWSRPEDWVGRNGLFVGIGDDSLDMEYVRIFFEKFEDLGDFQVRRGGIPIRHVHFYRCVRQLGPFPFDGRVLSEELESRRDEVYQANLKKGGADVEKLRKKVELLKSRGTLQNARSADQP